MVFTRVLTRLGWQIRYGLAAGALTVGIAAGAVPVAADEIQDWQRDIVKKIIKTHIYPRSAIAREIEGSAKVQVTIDRSGKITGYDIVEPSGQAQLDKVIPKMMEKLDPLPSPPASLPDGNLSFVIPIAWRLQ
ncbi:TonB family protein [Kordiimonas sp.]|uniref:TonB family protein n=1 Tax=Kordiimonas sp. TaxID=1970157 RepID=UPI003A94F370